MNTDLVYQLNTSTMQQHKIIHSRGEQDVLVNTMSNVDYSTDATAQSRHETIGFTHTRGLRY